MASQDNPKTVELYGMGHQHEAEAQAAINPGYLVERVSGGVQAHSTAGGPANVQFAKEYGMTGRSIDDQYESGDLVEFCTYYPGSGIYGLVAAGASAISQYDLLASAGDGTLATAGLDEVAVAQALEAVDNSGGATEARIKVEVIHAQRTNP